MHAFNHPAKKRPVGRAPAKLRATTRDDPARARSRTRSRFAAQCTSTAFPGRWYRKVERVRLRSHVRLAAVRGLSQWRSGGKMPSRPPRCAVESPRVVLMNNAFPRAPSSQRARRWEKRSMPQERLCDVSVPDPAAAGWQHVKTPPPPTAGRPL